MRPTCEYASEWVDKAPLFCGGPAEWRYPAMGGGYMHLCDSHAEPHKKYAEQISMTCVRGAPQP